MKARYLTFFSYIGTSFRSSEKIWLKDGRDYPDPESVQGLMEIALLKLRSLNYPKLVLSSRTDGGVHALNSSAHFDLERFDTNIYDAEYITYHMNKSFLLNGKSILIKKCMRVNDDFNARFKAISRTYLYRFAVLKEGVVIPENHNIGQYMPIEEWCRCHFVRLKQFDIERFKEGAKYFEGYHDFTTFKKFDKANSHKHNRRELKSIVVRPGRSLVTDYTSHLDTGVFDYWDVIFHGRAFVHNQIRRIIGTLLMVASGKLQPEEIKLMLQIPSKHSWHSYISCSPPHGLYLCNVEYDPKDLIFEPTKESVTTENIDEDCDE